ncbi:hypothetical protein EV421DRAFT_1132448 [Armillaria borealis]|uniref:Uncharacterized protein n=1 Tax=Armillaria borealis TaxID=47425 RepID=A0AA39MIM4_9AGAR|nr:hypothetical protein EV421DRAFT_1132448 [Armillaria borealis]
MTTASRKYKVIIGPDLTNGRSPFGHLQIPICLLRDIALAPFLDTTALRVCRWLLHNPLQHKSLLAPTTMPALNACLQVARLAEAGGDSVLHLVNVAKVTVLVFRLLDQKAKNKESAKELCESIANTSIPLPTVNPVALWTLAYRATLVLKLCPSASSIMHPPTSPRSESPRYR